jgi:hypothetical protein
MYCAVGFYAHEGKNEVKCHNIEGFGGFMARGHSGRQGSSRVTGCRALMSDGLNLHY